MRIFDSKPALRWLAPLALVLAVSGTGLVAATASADGSLPPTTPEKLLADVQQAKVDGLSGTVVQQADLGIPAIPGTGGGDDTQLTSLISGNHTLRVVYSAPDKSRLAVLGTMGETDVIRNGSDLWTWSSNDQTATHRTLAADEQQTQSPSPQPTDVPKTPEEAAQQVLNALTPTTTVTVDSAVTVAKRNAYDLVLDPNDGASLIKQVRIAVDGETKVPLQVVVYGRDNQVVFKVGYTGVSFARPDDSEFVFNAPPGTKVTEAPTPEHTTPSNTDPQQTQAKADTKVVGKGWTSVVVTKVPSGSQPDQLKAFTDKLQEVSGTWGKGRLLAGTAFSVLLTDDGRLAAGAVSPDALYAALG
jgi:outer membrane lipoprotein-sorting protein